MAAMEPAIWPLMGLEVVTPMLTLRYIIDDLGVELALLAAEGVHDPATMPFSTPWTDVPSPELERNTLRFYWRNRADTTVEHLDLNLAVVVDGVAVGMCSIEADAFPTRRSAETGSWVGRRYQHQGIGREVRHAALTYLRRIRRKTRPPPRPGTTTPLHWGSPARCPTSRRAPRSSSGASAPTPCWNSP